MAITTTKSPPNLLSLSFITFLLICTCFASKAKASNGNIKGMFVFGSSLVDNGNNNFLLESLVKADYFPYGIDFPFGPSGRFTNGKNVIDVFAEKLRLPAYIPAYTNPLTRGPNLIHGVNYASGGSGILDETGSLVGVVMSLNQQIKNFEEVTLPELKLQLGIKSRQALPNYLFVVGSGGNDYTLNYFLTKLNSNISLQAFTANLTASLTHQLKRLYSLGGRKFVLMSLNPLGCSPNVKARQPMGMGCNQNLNAAANLFNTQLKSLVDVIKPQMPGSSLVYVNAYKIIRGIINNPTSRGFSDTSNPCCEIEPYSRILCKIGGSTCANRSTHVYFDGLHPTEAVNVLLASKAYISTVKTEVYPFSIQQLETI